MIPTLKQFLNAVCPNLDASKRVLTSRDQVSWFKILDNTLVLPDMKMLYQSPIMLNKAVESLTAFDYYECSNPRYQWDNLNLTEYSTNEKVAEALGHLAQDIIRAGGIVACDIETRHTGWDGNKLLSIGFAYSEDTCIALYDFDWNNEYIHNALQDLFSNKDIVFIWHNGKFDRGRLKYLADYDVRVDQDTMIMHYVGINEKRGTHGLKSLGPLYLAAPQWDDELDSYKDNWCRSHKVKKSDFMYDQIDTSILIPYMQRDCIATYRLYYLFKEMMPERFLFVYNMLIRSTNIYGDMELDGIEVDMDYLEDLEYSLEVDLQKASDHLNMVADRLWDPLKYSKDTGAKVVLGSKFNLKSPKQLKWMLKQVLGYTVDSTDAATIEKLSEMVENGMIADADAKEFLNSIAVVRKLSKYMDTYVQGIREVMCNDFRVRCSYNLHGTETGRLSCSEPNMQNIPRDSKIKNLFKAHKGYKLLQLDYSQAELRVLAVLSNDDFMIKAYQDGKDLHDAVATDMFGPNFDKEQRVMAKTINFGIAYGRGPKSIADKFNLPMSEAISIIDKWFKPMPGVKKYLNAQKAKPRKGDPCITYFGRERHFIISDSEMYHIQNEYINTPIQSLASDLTMLSLQTINEWLSAGGIPAKIVATVHDSILLEVIDDRDIIDMVAQKCIDIMSSVPAQHIENLAVPFLADAEWGDTWGALKKWKPVEVEHE